MMETSVSIEEVRRAIRELAEQSKETDRHLKSLAKRFGDLGNRLGEFVEGMVRPGLVRLFRERGLELHQTFRDMSARQGKEAAQIDLMAIDETVAVAVEVKSRLTIEAVDEHLKRMEKFRRLFPRFSDLRVLAAVAAMVIDDEAAAYAEASGLFVIGQAGDDAVLLNSERFEPRAW
ncbi:MAG: DUF3782 domain-containing protein [Proteobacteria bacterium]|jgi:hypothetical protein|nr:DUF3782 domain-containing protein [Pseudomonadota bacterium]